MKHTIQLPASALKAAFPGLARVIPTRSHVPILRAVRIVRDTGTVTIHGTDLDSFLRYRIDNVEPGPAAQLLVPFGPLRDIVKPCRADEIIRLTLDRRDRVTVRCAAGEIPIDRTFEEPDIDDWPKEPPGADFTVPVDDCFKQALREALDCCAEDCSRPVLRGALLEAGREAGHLVGTDGRHLYCANSFPLDLPRSVILPSQRFLVWPEFARDGQWTVGLRPGTGEETTWVQVNSARWSLVTRAIDGQFPDWRNSQPAGQEHTHVRLGEQAVTMLIDVLPRLPVANEQNQPVGLSVRDAKLWLQSRASQQEPWYEILIPEANVTGPDSDVRFNRTFFLKALRWGLVEIELRDDCTPLVFRSGGRQLVVAVCDAPQPSESPDSNTPSPPETPVCPPSGPRSQPPTEPERTPMTNTVPTPATASPATPTAPPESSSPQRALVDHVEKIRGSLRDLLGQVTETVNLLKAAERQQKATEQEVESVRRTLRGLQKVQL